MICTTHSSAFHASWKNQNKYSTLNLSFDVVSKWHEPDIGAKCLLLFFQPTLKSDLKVVQMHPYNTLNVPQIVKLEKITITSVWQSTPIQYSTLCPNDMNLTLVGTMSSVPSKEDAGLKVILFAVSVRKNRPINHNTAAFLFKSQFIFTQWNGKKLTLKLGSSLAGMNV